MRITDTTTKTSYFRNDLRYGRTTQLVEKKTSRVIFEGIGTCSRKDLWVASTADSMRIKAGEPTINIAAKYA